MTDTTTETAAKVDAALISSLIAKQRKAKRLAVAAARRAARVANQAADAATKAANRAKFTRAAQIAAAKKATDIKVPTVADIEASAAASLAAAKAKAEARAAKEAAVKAARVGFLDDKAEVVKWLAANAAKDAGVFVVQPLLGGYAKMLAAAGMTSVSAVEGSASAIAEHGLKRKFKTVVQAQLVTWTPPADCKYAILFGSLRTLTSAKAVETLARLASAGVTPIVHVSFVYGLADNGKITASGCEALFGPLTWICQDATSGVFVKTIA